MNSLKNLKSNVLMVTIQQEMEFIKWQDLVNIHLVASTNFHILKKEKAFCLNLMINKKTIKYNSIENKPNKKLLKLSLGNYEIDSFIEKSDDKQTLLTFIDIHSSNFYAKFSNYTMKGFSNALQYVIVTNTLEINIITMNNGGKNNLLWKKLLIKTNCLITMHMFLMKKKL